MTTKTPSRRTSAGSFSLMRGRAGSPTAQRRSVTARDRRGSRQPARSGPSSLRERVQSVLPSRRQAAPAGSGLSAAVKDALARRRGPGSRGSHGRKPSRPVVAGMAAGAAGLGVGGVAIARHRRSAVAEQPDAPPPPQASTDDGVSGTGTTTDP